MEFFGHNAMSRKCAVGDVRKKNPSAVKHTENAVNESDEHTNNNNDNNM